MAEILAPIPGGGVSLTSGASSTRQSFSCPGGSYLRVWNADSTDIVYVELGDSTVEATSADFPIGPGQTVILDPANSTHIAGIASANTPIIYISPVHVHVGA